MSHAAGYDVWLFDLDGTLVDVEPSYVHETLGEVGDRLGEDLPPATAEAVWHGFGAGANHLLRQRGIDVEAFWRTFHEVEDPLSRAEAAFRYDDAAWVGALDRPVGLVTHCQSYLTEAVLDHLDIADWFDTVVCCSAETGWKPDPRPVELALADLGTDPDPAGPLVGDGPADVGAAWNAGLEGIHVERHGHERRGCCVLGDRRLRSLAPLAPDGSDDGRHGGREATSGG
ncbi:HAD family hydrolase [Halobacteriales archaeon QS_4_70_19]|nr:MAG: HAD family hydrolase [Halobacteriales archaeon QS_4_70_19]